MTMCTINDIPYDVLRYVIIPFASEKKLSLVSKEFYKANKAFEYKELSEFYRNRIITKLLCPGLISQAKEASEEEKYDVELKLLKEIRCKIFGILKSCNVSKYDELNETYGVGSISHKKVFEAAKEILDKNLQKIWIEIREQLIENNIPENKILDKNANAQQIRTWFNNPENRIAVKSITMLSFWDSGLTILSPEIGYLTGLEWLNLSGNKITTLPASIGNLKELKWLDLRDNNIIVLPETMGCLTKLVRLDLSGNKISKLPKTMKNLIVLKNLNLKDNNLTNRFLGWILKLIALTALDLRGNDLKITSDILSSNASVLI